jgi:hypothetical protein
MQTTVKASDAHDFCAYSLSLHASAVDQFGSSIFRFLLFLVWTVPADYGPPPERSAHRVAELCGEVTLSFLFSLFNNAQCAILF